MSRRLPVLATLVVLAAIAVMLRLGFWQLGRMEQKAALLERYAAAATAGPVAAWPRDEAASQALLYRRASLDCRTATGATTMAGTSARGESGVVHVVTCALANGDSAKVVLGWSRDPAAVRWDGGAVAGVIAPGPRLVADPPLAGLAANARPDPADIPNNHLSYAVQWFLFAATALVIYAIAVWKRLAVAGSRG